MARAALRIALRELARRARTTPKSLFKIENGRNIDPGIKWTVRTALEEAWATFISSWQQSQGGVSLTKKRPEKSPKRNLARTPYARVGK